MEKILRPVREITAEEENFRTEPLEDAHGQIAVIKRDPVEPELVGSYVVKVFKITGYDPDCDGSLMARLSGVDRQGRETGWTQDAIGLYPDSSLVLITNPESLWELAEKVD